MVTVHVTDTTALAGLPAGSGVLVPKPEQASTSPRPRSSRKWSHWSPPEGGEVLAVARPPRQPDATRTRRRHRRDRGDEGAGSALRVGRATARRRRSRHPLAGAFPQYQPHHGERVSAPHASVASSLPGLALAGASYGGVGIPACIRQGGEAAAAIGAHFAALAQ
ncbi:MAG: hypothetical protein R2705_10455 [Ilumatobacteraceae bacterium]